MPERPASSRKPARKRFTASGYLKWLEAKPGRLVAHYLIHCYLYYQMQTSVVSDQVFDALVDALGRRWDAIEHPHKALLDRDFLKSGFHIAAYPLIVKGAAESLLADGFEVN